jgi:type I restriction enzyme S subunit
VRRDDLESFAPATAQKNINLAVLADIELELPSLAEQLEIVRRVDKIFAFYDDLERRYQATVSRVEKLTPAVLTKAFRGALVPQDPKDEPADKLLERARASRQASVGLPRAKRKAPAKPRNLVAS